MEHESENSSNEHFAPDYFSKCGRYVLELLHRGKYPRISGIAENRWLFQFPGVPTRLNFYRRCRRRRLLRSRRRWFAADHFSRYGVTGLYFQEEWLRASRFSPVIFPFVLSFPLCRPFDFVGSHTLSHWVAVPSERNRTERIK